MAAHVQRRRARSRSGWLAGADGPLVAALALLVAGCTTPTVEVAGEAAADGVADEDSEAAAAEDDLDAPPPPEPTDPDEPVDPGAELLRLDLPGVPAGGSAEYIAADLQCVAVNWSGPPDLVDGVRLTVTAIGFEPQGVYELATARCPGVHPPCLPDWLGADVCTVAVGWTGQPSTEDGELFFTEVVLTCETVPVDACRSFAHQAAAADARGPALRPFPDPSAGGVDDSGGDAGAGSGNGGDGETRGGDADSADVGESGETSGGAGTGGEGDGPGASEDAAGDEGTE